MPETRPLCSECGRQIETDDYVELRHPVARYLYIFHRECRPKQLPWAPPAPAP